MKIDPSGIGTIMCNIGDRQGEEAAMVALRALSWVDSPACRAPPVAAMPAVPTPMGECHWVDSAEGLAAMASGLAGCSEVALDLEHHSYRSYHGFTCLVQISTRRSDYLVDAMALRGTQLRDALGPVLEDPTVVKVLHGAAHDVLWMQKDFAGLRLVHLFDTGEAARVLGLPKHGLGYLMSRFAGVPEEETEDKKRFQVADWRSRPLSLAMQRYAQADTHFLLHIYDQLRKLLADKRAELQGRRAMRAARGAGAAQESTEGDSTEDEIDPFEDVMDRSRELCLRTYSEATFAPTDWLDAMYKANGSKRLPPAEAAVFEALFGWRDATARAEDESVSYVLSNAHLIALARSRPVGLAATLGVLQGPTRGRGRARDIPERLRRRAEEISATIGIAPKKPLADVDSWMSPAKRKRARAYEASLAKKEAAQNSAGLAGSEPADESGPPRKRRGAHTHFRESDDDGSDPSSQATPEVDSFSDSALLGVGDPEEPRYRPSGLAKFDDALRPNGWATGSLILALPPPVEPFAIFIPSDGEDEADVENSGDDLVGAGMAKPRERLIPEVVGDRLDPRKKIEDSAGGITDFDLQPIRNPGLRQALDDLKAKRERGELKKLRNEEASPMGEMVPMSVKERGQGARHVEDRHVDPPRRVTKGLERTGTDETPRQKRRILSSDVIPFDFEQARQDQKERGASVVEKATKIKVRKSPHNGAKKSHANSFSALKLIEGMRPGRSSRSQPRSGNRAG